ncbi:neuropeptide SIFamide receptor-like [Montipora capricornis]|uniref:neuropeptide SIFamide receptor-like n=1 Tax=Montipora capricornis TaxID=246305 RepID=UPI0035F15180
MNISSSVFAVPDIQAPNTTGQQALKNSFSQSYVIGVTVYAVIIFVVAIVGNSLVIYVVCTRQHMRNSTNILIANMAVGDILMAVVIPYVLKWLYVNVGWFGTFMGTVLCKFFHSTQALSIACSVISLVFISLDRCLVIWFPMRRIFTNKVLKASLIATWLYAILFSIPLILVANVHARPEGNYVCYENGWPSKETERSFLLVYVVGTYVFPLVVITTAYALIAVKLCKRELPGVTTPAYQKKAHESTKKAITMLVTVVVVFALCWLPLQGRELMIIYFPETIKLFPVELKIFLTWIGITNSAINPCLYVIFSENFRREFGRILCGCVKENRPDSYLGIPASRATPLTTPSMSRRAVSATNIHEAVPLRHLTVKH